MSHPRLSKRARITKQIGRDPAELVYEMVYLQNRTLGMAGQRFGVDDSTASRWLTDWMKEQDAPQPAASVA